MSGASTVAHRVGGSEARRLDVISFEVLVILLVAIILLPIRGAAPEGPVIAVAMARKFFMRRVVIIQPPAQAASGTGIAPKASECTDQPRRHPMPTAVRRQGFTLREQGQGP